MKAAAKAAALRTVAECLRRLPAPERRALSLTEFRAFRNGRVFLRYAAAS